MAHDTISDRIAHEIPGREVAPGIIDRAEIELINAYGPYNHAAWSGRDLVITAEEALSGRGNLLVKLIREQLLELYSLDALRAKSVADVGCYDGFVLHALSDLPFKRLVGFEPREKNIVKGRMIRELLEIETRCDFLQADLDEIGDEIFDIVICTGVLHHLASPLNGIAKLRSICRERLFMETICLPESLVTAQLRTQMEIKDLPNFTEEPFCGITGHKIESGYLDGSATTYGVVSIASLKTLEKYLQLSGFDDMRFPIAERDYSDALTSERRQFSAVFISAAASASYRGDDVTSAWIREYETGMLGTLLPQRLIADLFDVFVGESTGEESAASSKPIVEYLRADTARDRARCLSTVRTLISDRFGFEIVKNLHFSAKDKIRLEFAKQLMFLAKYEDAVNCLYEIVHRVNADWRSVYRAFCLLAGCEREMGNAERTFHYRNLCHCANPQFPRELVDNVTAFCRIEWDEPS